MKGEGLTLLFFWSKSIRLPLETWASRPRLTLIHIFSPVKCIIFPIYLQITKIKRNFAAEIYFITILNIIIMGRYLVIGIATQLAFKKKEGEI